MKKDRPGVVVSALCRADRRAELERAFFEHSTTLGVRWTLCERTECARDGFELVVRGHKLRFQRRVCPNAARELDARRGIAERDISVEYDDVAALARTLGVSLREAERTALAAAREHLGR